MESRQQPPWQQPPARPDARLPPLKVWNSLTRSKTPFVPLDPEGRKVKWYACGPTVYDDAHLGHARNYVSTDILRRILKDYFNYDVQFVMNITDVDDKIILRGRQQHLFNKYITEHPNITPEVLETARSAYSAYIKKNLPLINPDTKPEDFTAEVDKVYGLVLKGGSLEADKKPGDAETKIKMHVKTAMASSSAIADAAKKPETPSQAFYDATQDVFCYYLDITQGSTIPGDAYEIFTKLTKKYEDHFMRDMRDLNVLDPDEITRVTEYGPQIADFVEKIVSNKFGYVASDGSVYFDIKAFEEAGNHYARLEPWNRNNQPLQRDGEGALSRATEKKSPDDFALWKSSRPGEPSWSSKWGQGRPGWHIECSAMASSCLGSQIDIHSGGIDLAFPHHDNELAQSEAYWHEHKHQWVNYFLHMGHLSIAGSKMSKSLKNFTTISDALKRGDYTARSLRIVFLLGGWRDGVEITDELVKSASSWEEKVNNFFVKVKDPSTYQTSATDAASTETLTQALKSTQDKVDEHFCDSFDTPRVMAAISELITTFNSLDIQTLEPQAIESTAKWVTRIVTIFGLNGATPVDKCEIGWEGTDVPEVAKQYLYPLSAMRDSLRQVAMSGNQITSDKVKEIIGAAAVKDADTTEAAKPYSQALESFSSQLASLSLEDSKSSSKEILSLCDRLRDVDLFNLGIYLEDRENKPALVRPVTKDLLQAREEQARKALQRQQEKEKKERLAQEKLEKGKLSHLEMFKTSEFSAWDEEGMPTKDAAGEPLAKSRGKKLRKDWERQKKAHEAWLASQQGK
ncbi:cysteine--tRNA ligase [Aspergillus aculeatinus CBS 121060]|uniref:Cysteinyl-tRNA synthetase n=1 Tax=Aspergillus aculeatinus CBS 121060 TaxID=1448322 RepID=A0ACD1GVQ5_9EURO|nr:cysteinyl-tRNA synthetase [Aspergillus aculeatinus CBS 121060]RAH65439.1 cysteinyl-tRNA synthetase [Aspergillus aculeatinus CBS 121060]